jgi:nitroreductase
VCAPRGGNMQRWRFLVIKDAAIKQTVGVYYKRVWDEQVGSRFGPAPSSALPPTHPGSRSRTSSHPSASESDTERHP